MATEILRPYIKPGDWVRTEDNMTGDQMEGVVALDAEGELRVSDPHRDPHGPDGHNVNARWINVLSWKGA